MKKIAQCLGLTAILTLTGCATGQIKPTYVSPTQFQSMNCAELHMEYARLKQYLAQGVEPQKRNAVGVGMGVGFGGPWGVRPNISVNMGQSSNSKRTEISKLLGQQDAIAQAAQFKQCPIQHPRQ